MAPWRHVPCPRRERWCGFAPCPAGSFWRLQNVHGHRGGGTAAIMRQPEPRVCNLVRVLAAQLHRHFVELSAPGGAGRMAFGQESTARIDDNLGVARRRRTGGRRPALALCKEAEIFAVDDFCDRETI